MVQKQKSKKETLDVLVDLGFIYPEQKEEIIKESQERHITPEKIIEERGAVTEEVLTKAKAVAWQIPFINLNRLNISANDVFLIPRQAARHYQSIIFYADGKKIKVAMVDPKDYRALDYLKKKTQRKPEIYIASPSEITSTIDAFQKEKEDLTEILEQESEISGKETEEEIAFRIKSTGEMPDEEGDITEAPVTRIINDILDYSIDNRASDIHMEGSPAETRVRVRVDGILQEFLHYPKNLHPAVVSKIKIMANLKIDEKRVPQDGRIRIEAKGEEFDLRVSTLPTIFGEKIVIRLLATGKGVPSLSKLGFRGRSLEEMMKSFKKTKGLILSTGPTGSGKSTTLYSCLGYVNTEAVNTITLEDPVEHTIHGTNQVQINSAAGLTFGKGLRAVVRQDPDIILVGEIRDQETAALCIQAALTGHLVFSTLHTNSAAGAIPRLLDMGLEPFLITSTLENVVGQRLVRKVCSRCKTRMEEIPQKLKDEVKLVLENILSKRSPEKLMESYPNLTKETFEGKFDLFQGRGCNFCRHSGYMGRTGLFENILPSTEVNELVMKRASDLEIQNQARAEGMLTMKEDGILKTLEGITTYEEVLRVTS